MLSGWLILLVVGNTWIAYRYFAIIQDFVEHRDPRFTGNLQWGLPTLTALALLDLVFVAGMWWLRKWGLYGYMAVQAIALVISLTLGVQFPTLLIPCGGLAILGVLIALNWEEFR
jgi:hypothetical protein